MIPTERKLLTVLLDDDRVTDIRRIAYIMGTVAHETNQMFEPVEEAYWLAPEWRQKNLRYWPYHGRGFVQITWKENYEKLSIRLNKPEIVSNPESVMDWDTAYEILVVGMVEGIFTGKDLDDFINEHHCDYRRARKIVNGMDKANLVASYAYEYEGLIREYKLDEPTKPILRHGDKGGDVELAQEALSKWATLSLEIGVFGMMTDKFLRYFQKDHGLAVDGIVGPHTWTALERYL